MHVVQESKPAAAALGGVSIALAAAAAAAGIVLGGGVGSVARAVLLLLSAGALAAGLAAMAAEGRWRIVLSPFWLLPIPLLFLALAQLGDFWPSVLGGAAATGKIPGLHGGIATANRHQTLEAVFFLLALTFVSWAAAHQCRGRRMLAWLVGGLAAVLVVVGLVQISGESWGPIPLGPIAAARTRDGAIGALAYRPWRPVDAMTDAGLVGVWFAPIRDENAILPPSAFAASCALLLPILASLMLQPRTSRTGRLRSMIWFALTAGVGAVAAWVEPVVAIVAGSAGLSALVILGSSARVRLAAVSISLLVVMSAPAGVRFAREGGSNFSNQLRAAIADGRDLARATADVGCLGGGIGAFGDLWPMYREDGSRAEVLGPAILAMGVEAGWFGLATFAVATLLGITIVFRRLPKTAEGSRAVSAGLAASGAAFLACGLAAPAAYAPAVLVVASLCIGLFARGFALADAWPAEVRA